MSHRRSKTKRLGICEECGATVEALTLVTLPKILRKRTEHEQANIDAILERQGRLTRGQQYDDWKRRRVRICRECVLKATEEMRGES